MKIHHLIPISLLLIGGLSAQVSLFDGGPGQPGNVVILGQMGLTEQRPIELQGIVFLPLDCVGRTQLTELLEDQTRRRTDVSNAARLLLPGERGSLYKYRRDEVAGGATFGFCLVRPSGMASSLFELHGTGSAGTGDPLPEKVAVAAGGRAFLVASSAAAGGDLWEIDLLGTALNRTPHLAPLDFERNGLVLLSGWGLGVSGDGVYRFNRVAGGRANAVTLPITPRWFGPDVVRSADESTVAFLAGNDVGRALIFTCRSNGSALQGSDRPMHIPGAGFLPEDPSGPALALSTDGSWIAWRAEGSTTRECFVRETRGARPQAQLVTGPLDFYYTLNDTGVIAFFDRDSLSLVVGRSASEGIQRGDLFRVDITSSTSFVVRNLSRTSGVTQPPFDYGTLDTADGLFQVPGSAAFVLHDGAGSERLLWVEASGGALEVLDRVASLDSMDVVGSYLVAAVHRPPGVGDPLQETLDLVQIPPGGLGATVARLPTGCSLSRTVGSRSRDTFAAIVGFATGERLGRLRIPSTSGMLVSPDFLSFGPTTGLSADGAIVATVEVSVEHAAFAWTDFGTKVLKVMRGESFLLPGL